MLSPGIGTAAHAVWSASLVRPCPSYLAARCRDYALISTEPGSVAAHHDARHQLSWEFTSPAHSHSPDGWHFLGGGRSFRGRIRGGAFDRQSAPQSPAESSGR